MDDSQGLPRGGDVFVEAFARGLSVIRAFGFGHGELTLSQVAERAGLTPAGARRLLYTLISLGYARVQGRMFSLTPAVLDLGYSYLSSLTLREVSPPFLDKFARETGEACSTSVLDRTDIVFVARAEIRSPSARRLITGERLPAHCTSTGQLLLAHLPDEELQAYFAHAPFERLTKFTLTTERELRPVLMKAREQGFSLAAEQFELGTCGLAVPIRDRDGAVVAALTLSLNMAKHSPPEVVPRYRKPLQALADEIGAGLVR